MGWDDWGPIDVGRNLISRADTVKDAVVNRVEDTTTDIAVNTIEAYDRTKDFAVSAFQFQGAVTRAGLDRAINFTGNVADRGIGAVNNFRNALFNIDFTPGASNPPAAQGLEFSETKGASQLAYNANRGEVYRFPDGKEWEVVDVMETQGFFESGFRAIALRNGNEVIVAYAGTDPKSPGDIANDLAQGIGFAPAQYRQAVQFAQKWQNQAGAENVRLTGHSLGGGLAAYASVNTGLRATTVNSAPLALTNLGGNPFSGDVRNNPNITHYYVPGEVLTLLDVANPLDNRPGNTIAVEGETPMYNPLAPISNHSIGSAAPDIPLPEKVR